MFAKMVRFLLTFTPRRSQKFARRGRGIVPRLMAKKQKKKMKLIWNRNNFSIKIQVKTKKRFLPTYCSVFSVRVKVKTNKKKKRFLFKLVTVSMSQCTERPNTKKNVRSLNSKMPMGELFSISVLKLGSCCSGKVFCIFCKPRPFPFLATLLSAPFTVLLILL